jgi:hypothetical protein
MQVAVDDDFHIRLFFTRFVDALMEAWLMQSFYDSGRNTPALRKRKLSRDVFRLWSANEANMTPNLKQI